MRLAQGLYEGREIGDLGTVGLITYMRTDSTRVSDEAIGAVRDYIAETYGKPKLVEFFKSVGRTGNVPRSVEQSFGLSLE